MYLKTLVIITEGGTTSGTPVSLFMRESRDRLTVEAIQQFQACQNIFLVVCTNRQMILQYCEKHCIPYCDTGSEITAQSLTSFDYLGTVQSICKTYIAANETIGSAIVLGGTALPLANSGDLQKLIDSLQTSKHCVWANNPLSPDVVGWTPICAIHNIKSVQNDNELAAALRDQAHLSYEMWPRTITYSYDIDTPIDLWLAMCYQKLLLNYDTYDVKDGNQNSLDFNSRDFNNRHTKVLFKQLECTISDLLERIHNKKLPNITLIGRVSPQTVQFLNQTVKARVRCFSEERGMKGLQRDKHGNVWSLVADWFERFESYKEAFELLAQESDAILMDTRVWMAHHRLEVAEEDRFASDLLQVERIGQGKLRELTDAARACAVPVLFGGFGLVNQGILLLLHAHETRS